jgi:hypothetical protein
VQLPRSPLTKHRISSLVPYLRFGKELLEAVAFVAGAIALILVYQTLKVQQKTNIVSNRQAIIAQYQVMAQREISEPGLFMNLFEHVDASPAKYPITMLQTIAPHYPADTPLTLERLGNTIWSAIPAVPLPASELQNLRRLELHAQSYLDFLEEVIKARSDGEMTASEAQTWLNILHFDGLVCHPIFEYVLSDARTNGFYSRALAVELQRMMNKSKPCQPVIKAFFPAILAKTWPDGFVSHPVI